MEGLTLLQDSMDQRTLVCLQKKVISALPNLPLVFERKNFESCKTSKAEKVRDVEILDLRFECQQ